ncbi:MAG: ABC transporter ATP-binding protein [Desulfobulbus sp.]|jgi:iron complex transport system ATP-binding protein|nr:ABC transporter ATP-binding protein [Desulfobulbus sp.]
MILDTRCLHFAYNGADVLREIDFQVQPGELLAILGPNGVGKTTLLKCINAMLTPIRGVVEVEGADVLRMRPTEIATRIGYVAQKQETARLTVFDAVLMGRTPHLRWRPSERDLRMVEATLHHLHLESHSLRRIDQLSGGELQKVCLGRALVQEPRLLLLDEPTSALDLKNQFEIMQLLRHVVDSHGMGAVMTMHDLNKAMRYADTVLMLKNGRVHSYGPTREVTATMIEAVYGLPVEIHRINGCPLVVPCAEQGCQTGARPGHDHHQHTIKEDP